MNVYRMDKIMVTIGGFFAAFAVIMFMVGVGMMIGWASFSKTCESTDAVITSIERTRHGKHKRHRVTVEYSVDGEVYSGSLGYYISSMRRGQHVTVYYDPEDPSYTMSKPYIACAAIAVFDLIFGALGVIMLGGEFRNKKIINRLAEEGKYIILDGSVERREVSANVKVNDVRYMQTDFIYRDRYGYEHVFSSRAYPPGRCPFDPWQSVTVYVDIENNPKKYYVCTDNEYFTGDKERYPDNFLKH